MALRIDDDARTLELGVHDLLDAGPPSGDLRLQVAWSARARMRAGTQAHTTWQARRAAEDPDFAAEVTIKHRMVVRGWEVTVRGRVDGLSREGTHEVVEEVKSSTLPGAMLAGRLAGDAVARAAAFPAYVQQVRLYLWFLANQGRPAVGRLVLISLVDGTRHVVPVPDAGDIGAYVERQLDWILLQRERLIAWRAHRRRTTVPFAHPSYRPGQQDLAEQAAEALDRGQHLLLSAPTGMGKTAAALWAALRHAYATDKRVFFATARTTQQRMAEEAARRMAEMGLPMRAVTIRARDKVCLNDVVACRPESCRFASGYHDKVRGGDVVVTAWGGPSIDAGGQLPTGTPRPDDVMDVARQAEVCPFALTLDLVADANLVIGDYNYVFDPAVRLSELSDAPGDWIVIVDEAHNLPERAMGYASPVLPLGTVQQALDDLGGDPALRPFVELAEDVEAWIAERVELVPDGARDGAAAFSLEEGLQAREVREFADRVDALALDYALVRLERGVAAAGEADAWMDMSRVLLRLRSAMERAGDETVVIWRRPGRGRRRPVAPPRRRAAPPPPPSAQLSLLGSPPPPPPPPARPSTTRRVGPDDPAGLSLLCRDPSPLLGPFFDQLAGSVCMSATLAPAAFYTAMFGLDDQRGLAAAWPSPFPSENRRVLVCAEVSTAWRHRDRDRAATAALISSAVQAVPGNAAVFFPSFAMLEALAPLVEVGDHPVLVQDRRMDEDARAQVLDTLGRGEGHVLFAVLGGIFAEGIDLPGSGLLAAVVVGPALPAATLERKLLQQWFEERYDQGFTYAWLVPGMSRVVQAAGRVIRTPDDIGAIVLVGQRFVRNAYNDLLPEDWVVRRSRDPGADLAGHWGAEPSEPSAVQASDRP